MATLTGKTPATTYKDLLQVSNANAGIDATLRPVSDGEGTDSTLQLSTTSANFTGNTVSGPWGTFTTVDAAVFTISKYPSVPGLTTTGGKVFLDVNALTLANVIPLYWSSTGDNNGAKDVGLARASAGVLKVTDGSTGLGQLSVSIPSYADNAAALAAIGPGRLYYTDSAGERIVKVSYTP